LGLIANLVEFPAVPKGQARFRMQVMAKHTEQNIADAVLRLRTALDEGTSEFQRMGDAPLKAIA
jgi:glycine C-acetyltransferase